MSVSRGRRAPRAFVVCLLPDTFDKDPERPVRPATLPHYSCGLATVVTDSVRIGGQTIKVEVVMITDTGRRALEDSASGNTSLISGKGQATSGTGKITTATRRAFSASYATSSVPAEPEK